MPDTVRPAGRRLAAFAAVGLAVAVATCRDNPAGPAGGGRGVVNIEPVFAAGFEPANFGIAIDSIRALVIRPVADTVLERRVPFPADSSSIQLDLTVVLAAAVETLTVTLEYRGGGVVLFRGSRSVEVRTGASGGTPPQPIPVAYVGPGALVDSLYVTPDDSVITWGDSLRFRVAAFQGGVPVTQFYVSWTSSDASNAPINGFGIMRAPSRRDSVYVTATTPSGARDSARVAFRPVPTAIARAGGDGQSALLGAPLPQPLRVRVTASDGLGVQQVPVRFRAAMGGGSVADTVAYTDGSGFAQTIATLGLMVGGQSFEASLTPSRFVTFSATALANTPTRLEFTVEPSTTLAASAITPPVQVTARDAGGGVSTGFNGPITVALLANPGGGTLSGTATVNAAAGVATFANLSLDRAAAGYTLLATATGLTPDTSAAFTIDPRAATELAFTVQPTTTTAGAPVTPAVVVTARDALGNTATGFTGNVTVAIATNPAGGTLSGTATMAAVSGVATFSDLAIDRVGVGYTFAATASGLSGATSAAFDITPGPASQLAFTVDPTTATAGAAISPAVVVTARDAQGNTATGFTGPVTVAIGTNPGGGTLSGTLTQSAAAGVATFPGLSINRTGVGYTLTAGASGLTGTTSAAFDVTPGVATQLAFTVEPAPSTAGVALAPAVQVTARDALGNAATAFTGNVTVALGANPGSATLSGTTTSAAVAGVASFADLSLDKVGTGYTLTATASGLTGATSATFDITPAAASQLAFAVQPTNTTAGATISAAPVVHARDAFGNLATAFAGNVTVAIGTNPGSGTLSGTVTVAAAGGVASFGDLSIDRVGTGYTLTAAATGLTGATSGAFDITPAAASQLAFIVEPVTTVAGGAITPAMQVAALDAFGNTATAFTGSITLAIGANPGGGTLSGPATQAASAGVATFAGLSINRSGVGYTLTASATGLAGSTSAAFDITPGAAAQLVFTVQPTATIAGQAITPAVAVTARDAQGNTATSYTGTVNIAIGTNPGGGTLSGTTAQTAVSGVATFAGLSIDRTGVGYTLSATATGLTGATSAAFDITPGAATQLAFTVQPTNATAGAPIMPAVVVTARDALGNTATGFTGAVTVAIGTNPGGGTLTGTTTVGAAGGVASFGDLSIDLVGTGYTLTASAGGLTGTTSVPFDVISSTATQLVFTVGPTTTVAGAPITPAIEVTAQDAFGNTATGFTAGVTIVIGTNPGGGTLAGTTTRAAVAGVATFPGLSINRTGTGYTLSAGSGGLPSASSAAFDIVPGPATELVFTQQPVNTVAGAAITPAVQVTARDAAGNVAAGFTGTVAMAIGANPGGGTLSGTTSAAAVGGIATFASLSIDRAAAGYTLAASATGLTGATSTTFAITAAAASELVFSVPPSTAAAGAAIAPAVQVTARDPFGNTATGFAGTVAVAIGTNPAGGTLSGTTSAAASAGVATFADLSIDRAGTGYTLTASATGLTGATSAAFDITPGAATQLVFIVEPSTTAAGVAIAPAVIVDALDAFGNLDTAYTGSVSIAIETNPAGGTLSGATTVVASAGSTSFADLSIDRAGTGYTLTASASGLTPVTSSPFDITPGAATQLVFTVEPTNVAAGAAITPAVEVTAQDAFGNTVPSFVDSVFMDFATNATGDGILSGTRRLVAVAGVATFADLSVDLAGSGYTLEASAAGLTPDTSAAFDVTPGPISAATSIVTASDSVVGVGSTLTFTLQAYDQFSNPLNAGGDTIVFTAAGGTSDGTISPTSDLGNGTYTAIYTGTVAGTEDTIGATVNGQPVTSTPLPTVRVFSAATVHSADILANETWTAAQNPHVVTAYIRVRNGATLTIEDGAEVRFDAGAGLQVGDTTLAETGGLIMQGTPGTIRLTANTGSPTPGFWRGLEVQRGLAVPAWKNVVIEYAGGPRPPQTPATEACVLVVNDQGQAFTMDSVKIRRCVHAGIHLFGGNLQVRRSSIDSVTGSGIHVDFRGRLEMDSTRIVGSGQEGLLVASPIAGLTTNEFNKFLGNGTASVRLQAPQLRGFKQQDSIAGNGFLPGGFGDSIVVAGGLVDGGGTQFRLFAQAAPYLVLGHLKMVNAPIILMPGLVMAFDQGAGFQFGDSTAANAAQLNSQGTAANPVRLTSRSGAPGWPGLYLGRQSGPDTLTNVRIENGGYLPSAPSLAGNLVVDAAGSTGPVRIVGMRSTDSRSNGIVVRSAPSAGVRVLNDTITGSAGFGVLWMAAAGAGDSLLNVQTSGNGYPAYTMPMSLPAFLANDFTGNVRDTLLLTGGTLSVPATLPHYPGAPWRVMGSVTIDGGALTVGADTVFFDDSVQIQVGKVQSGGLRAVGTTPWRKLFTATPGHLQWWGILYGNVTPGGASPFTTLNNVVIEKAGHLEPCFGDCGPTPFGGIRYYNQSSEAVTFDSIVVRWSFAHALDVQPTGTGGLTVLRSQFYANQYFPMIKGPTMSGNGAKLKVQFSDLYAYGYQAISSVYQGGPADSVDATSNWWGDVAGPQPSWSFQDSLGRAALDFAAVAIAGFRTSGPYFPVGLADSLAAIRDTVISFSASIGDTLPVDPPSPSYNDSLRVRALDAWGRGVFNRTITWTPTSGSVFPFTSGVTDVGGRSPGVRWATSTVAGPQAASAFSAGLKGSPVNFRADLNAGSTQSINWQMLPLLTPGGMVAGDSNSVSYTSSNKPSALKTNARDQFGNVTTPTGLKFTTGTCPLGQPDGTLGSVDSLVGDTIYFRPLGLGSYKLCAFYDGGLVQDSVLISVATNIAGIAIDRDKFALGVQDTGRYVFNALCPTTGPCGFASQRDFTAFTIDSGGAVIANPNARYVWSRVPPPPDTTITIDSIFGSSGEQAFLSAHAAGMTWVFVEDTGSLSSTPAERDSMLVLADQIGQFIVVTPDSASLLIGQSGTFQAQLHDIEGAPMVNEVMHFRADPFAPGVLTIIDTSVVNQVTVRLDSTPHGYTYFDAFWPRPLKDTLYGYFPGDTVFGFGLVYNPVQSLVDVGGNPVAAAVNSVTDRIYVTHAFTPNITVVNGADNRILTTIPVDGGTGLAAVNPKTNRIYAVENGGSRVFGIDGNTNTAPDTIAVGSFPFGIAVDTARNRVYVASQHCVGGQACVFLDFVTVIDGATASLVDTVFIGDQGIGLAYNAVTDRIYVAMFAGPVDTVKVIEAATLTVIDSIEVGSGAYGVAVNPVTNKIYVSNESDGTVSVIDGSTNAVTATIFTGFSAFPEGIGVDPVRNLVYVGQAGTSVIAVIDGATDILIGQIDVGDISTDAQPNPTTNRVYVPVYGSGQLRVLRYQ